MTANSRTLTLDDEEQFSFRFKRLPAYKTIESSSCSCCMLSFKREYPDGVQEEGLQAMVCYGCLQITHRYCYGVSTTTKEQDNVNYFVCDGCWEGSKQHPPCEVCKNTGGLLKLLKEGGFVHPLCGFTHPEMNVLDYSNLEFKKAPFYGDTLSLCQICEKENAYMKCSEQNCGERVHPFCVVKKFKQKEEGADGQEVKDCWKFFMSAGESKLYGEVSQEKQINDFVSQNKDNRINSERGGFQYVLCPSHSQHVFYCNCGMEIEDQMVFCDCCLEWYHGSCTNFKDDGSDTFICPFCVSWFQLKDKILKQIKSNKLESYDLKMIKSPKLFIPDFILLALICSYRLAKATQTGINTTKISKAIELYPLKLSRGSSEDKKLESADANSFEQIDQWIVQNKQGKQANVFEIRHIEDLWEGFDQQIRSSQKYIKTRINYLTTWTNILRNANITVSYLKIRGLLYEYYEILRRYMMVSPTIIKTLKEPITFLEQLIQKLNPLIQKLNKMTALKQIQQLQDASSGVIDVSEIIIEAKVFFPTRKLLILDVKVLKPYNDLKKFYNDFRSTSQSLYEDRIVFKEQKKDESKRQLPTFEKVNEKNKEELKKKTPKLETSVSTDKKVEKVIPNIVTEQDRATIQKILSNQMTLNSEFNNIKSEDFVKIIQNQIFGEFFKNRNRYLQLSESFEMMFMTLEQCPLISAKAKKKNFEYTFMKELVENISRIKSFEEKLRLKQKQETQKTQAETKNQLPVLPAPIIDTKNKVVNSILSGKIEKKLEKQLEDIYAIQREKKQKERDRKYGHGHGGHRYDDRDRDRDRRDKRDSKYNNNKKDKGKRKGSNDSEENVEAKFSDEQDNNDGYNPLAGPRDTEKQKEKQRDYLEEELENKHKTFNDPILYDPDEDDKPVEAKQKDIEKGVILKIKSSSIQIYLNKQRKSFEGSMYTLDDSKNVKQLCDPAFEKLSIKKDKPQNQILEYLSKTSRKKYRFLIGWLQAERPSQNQYLKNLAIDCQNKQRVYGLQNQLAKIHFMSSRQLNKEMVNKFRSPNKVTSEQVAKYLNEHRMVYVLQYSVEKLYEIKSTTKQFSITPVYSFAEVISEPVYVPNVMQPLMPYGINMMPVAPVMMVNQPMDYRNEVYIDTWDPEPIPQMPIKMRKQFSPITSEDEGQTDNRQKKQAQANTGFDIMEIIERLDQSDITKLTQAQEPVHPPPSQQHQYSSHIQSHQSHQLHQSHQSHQSHQPQQSHQSHQHQPQRMSQPSSYLYQQPRMPMMNNPLMSRQPMGIPQQYNQNYPQQPQMQMRGMPNQNMMQPQQRYMMPNNNPPGYYSGHIPPPPGQYHPPRE